MIIIGTDIPAIAPHHIADAFGKLGRSDAVLGATPDGGYWLVGLRRFPRVLRPCGGVRWSCEHTLDDTLVNLASHTVSRAEPLGDVDGAEDWHAVRAWSGRLVLPLG